MVMPKPFSFIAFERTPLSFQGEGICVGEMENTFSGEKNEKHFLMNGSG